MRVLITGLKRGHEVVVMDNYSTSVPSNIERFLKHPVFHFIKADVVHPFPEDLKVHQIYHLACPASPVQFTRRPLAILNTCFLGTKNALEAARRCNARILLASTSEVYGQPERSPQDEAYAGNMNCFGPRSCYDEGKRVAEALAYGYRHESSLDIRIARIFTCYGSGMQEIDACAVSNFITAAIAGDDLVINGFQYVQDCVDGLECLMECDWQGGPVNIGSDVEMKIGGLAELIVGMVASITGVSQANIAYREPMPDDPVKRKPDCALARTLLGWQATTRLEEGLRRTIDWYLGISKGCHKG